MTWRSKNGKAPSLCLTVCFSPRYTVVMLEDSIPESLPLLPQTPAKLSDDLLTVKLWPTVNKVTYLLFTCLHFLLWEQRGETLNCKLCLWWMLQIVVQSVLQIRADSPNIQWLHGSILWLSYHIWGQSRGVSLRSRLTVNKTMACRFLVDKHPPHS